MPGPLGVALTLFGLLTTLAGAACGGRARLVPAYQIGRLSDDAVVARDADVRILVRTDEWRETSATFRHAFPIEVTIDNGSAHALELELSRFELMSRGRRQVPRMPTAVGPEHSAARVAAVKHGLVLGALEPGGRRAGFLFFDPFDRGGEVEFAAELQDATTGENFGRVVIPFSVE